MAMLIAWQVCNKAVYPQDKRFSKNIFIVAPGLTVKNRLQVLRVGGSDNYYAQFNIVPIGLMDKLRGGRVVINNCQALAWETEEAIKKRKSVDKRGAKSDEAYAREVLREMANARNILVINDEAHHAWRKNPEIKVKGLSREEKEEVEKATIWVGGLDRVHKTRGILACYDFSATPFAPSGKKNDEEALFGWIVSDFGLNDGIESGLVKTPRVVVRDDGIPDAKTLRSRLYHIYMDDEVKDDINRSATPEEQLPALLTQAYYLLGKDWFETLKDWRLSENPVPPVMITVANRTETAARIKYAFDHKHIPVEELCVAEHTIHIDSKTLDATVEVNEDAAVEYAAGSGTDEDGGERRLSKKEAAAQLRETVDTVGQIGKRGERVRNVISVGMLSEGWDAKTVTHVLGLRAFRSQLLCEQVIGRGLRRTSYDLDGDSGMFEPEYVNIFGIPFTFLPHESDESGAPKPPKPKTQIEPRPDKSEYEISFPNVLRIDRKLKSTLSLDIRKIETLELEASQTRLRADLAPIVDGKADLSQCAEIDLEKLDGKLRMQSIIFDTAGRVYESMKDRCSWQKEATKFALIGQIFRLVENYLASDAIVINPPLFNTDPLRRRILLMMNMDKIVQHLWSDIKHKQTESLVPILDPNKKVRSTGDMPTWYTGKPCFITEHSHISHCVFDSSWEVTESYKLEKNKNVAAWVKNDHLGFEIFYIFDGVVKKYFPDFLVRLKNGVTLVLETKGQKSRQSEEKRKALEEWVSAVNGMEEYGQWRCDVSYDVADVDGIIGKYV
jgi:type III restriction enzyme